MSFYDEEYYCPNCNAILNNQIGFDPTEGSWTCTECGQELYGDDVAETMYRYEGVVWHCDSCNAVLNKQFGFDDSCGSWRCTECGRRNRISGEDIYESEQEYKHCQKEYICPNCDTVLNEQSFFDHDDKWTCEKCGTDLYLDCVDEYSEIENNEDEEDDEDEEDGGDDTKTQRTEIIHRPGEACDVYWDEILRLKRKIRKLRLRAMSVILILLIVQTLAGYIVYYEYNNLLAIGVDSDQLIGEKYTTVDDLLRNAGLQNIKEKNVEDLPISRKKEEQLVTSVRVGNSTDFTVHSIFRRNAPVEITYHSMEKIPMPVSAKESRGKPYRDVIHILEAGGFVNISVVPQYDLVLGWLNSEEDIASIMVGESTDFGSGQLFRPDVKITITYHALRKDKPE